MAIKPITNKQVVASPNVKRVNQVSTRNETIRGNRGTTIVPGKDFTKNYSVTLKDIDTAVLNHIKNIIKPKVMEANEMVDVTVMYGNEERWKSVRKRGVMRDRNGSIILPLIMLRRTDLSRNPLSEMGYDHDVKREFVNIVRNSSWSKDNKYDRFSVLTGVQPKQENIVTGVPDYADMTYEFVLWTGFIEQMNPLVETFIAQSATYWGDSTDYKFLCTLDSITDATEINSDGERFVKSSFSVKTSAYLLPEYLNSVINNTTSNMKREIAPSSVSFTFESNASNEQIITPSNAKGMLNSDGLTNISGKFKNQKPMNATIKKTK